MRILFLTFYYEPDLCAGSFRSTALVKALSVQLGQNDFTEVLTTQPNRYQSFRCNAVAREISGCVQVIRFPVPVYRKSQFLSQFVAFMRYAYQVIKFLRGQKYDLIYATSSRLMTAFLGALLSVWKKTPLYLDIRDIFVETIQAVFPSYLVYPFLPVFRAIEKFTMRQAAHINLVSEGFQPYFQRHYSTKRYSFVSNGIAKEFMAFKSMSSVKRNGDRLIVLYAGNIGDGQGLHRIIPGLATMTANTHEFWIVGDGGAKTTLQRAVSGLGNVKIMPPVSQQALFSYYQKSDILFLHLNDYLPFKRVLPSKIFEYAATKKPILAGVSGYASTFLSRLSGVSVFAPCQVQAGYVALCALAVSQFPRKEFIESFGHGRLMQLLATDILNTAKTAEVG